MRAAAIQPHWRSGARVKTLLLATSLLALWAPPASAQDTPIQTLPGVDRFQLPPGNTQATPTPSPTPSPAPTSTPSPVAPPPVVRTLPSPTVTPTPAATRSPTPRPTPTAGPGETETSVSVAQPSPTPVAQPIPAPIDQASPQPTPTATPATPPVTIATPLPTPARTGEAPAWPWWLAGLGLAGIAGYALLARRRKADEPDVIPYEPVAPPSPPPATAPVRPTAAAAPSAAASAAPARPLAFDFRPQRLWTRGPNAYLAFELLLTNAGSTPLSAIRPIVSLASAGPETASEIAGFTAHLSSLPTGEPFDLRGGETRVVAGELTLSGDAMHVTTVAEREMIVPIAMVGATWRGGLSVVSAAEAFVIGPGDAASPKLGPVWVDRPGQIYGRLDARRFTPR